MFTTTHGVSGRMRVILSLLACVLICSCAYLPSVKDKLEVRPLNITTCEPVSKPKLPCGWLTGEVGAMRNFEVTAGWGKFRKVVGSENAKRLLSEETRRIFSRFAVDHVVDLGYCENAVWVPHDHDLLSSEGSGDKRVHVRCE